MFRKMRRSRQEMAKEESVDILEKGFSGVLAVLGDEGYPYTVPVNYVYSDGVIYFHCAAEGHKLDAIRKEPKVSFCVIGEEINVPTEFTAYYRSVVIFGKASVVTDDDERRRAVEKLAAKYSPNENAERVKQVIDKEWRVLTAVRIDIEYMTGKQAIELVPKSEQ